MPTTTSPGLSARPAGSLCSRPVSSDLPAVAARPAPYQPLPSHALRGGLRPSRHPRSSSLSCPSSLDPLRHLPRARGDLRTLHSRRSHSFTAIADVTRPPHGTTNSISAHKKKARVPILFDPPVRQADLFRTSALGPGDDLCWPSGAGAVVHPRRVKNRTASLNASSHRGVQSARQAPARTPEAGCRRCAAGPAGSRVWSWCRPGGHR
jgi:hypothetical protein